MKLKDDREDKLHAELSRRDAEHAEAKEAAVRLAAAEAEESTTRFEEWWAEMITADRMVRIIRIATTGEIPPRDEPWNVDETQRLVSDTLPRPRTPRG